MIAQLIIAAASIHPVTANTAPPTPIIQWDSAGFTPPAPPADATSPKAPAAALIERFLKTGGILGGGTTGGNSTTTWTVDGDKISVAKSDTAATFAELPAGWLALDAKTKESALLVTTVDANAMRTSAENLFDAPWLQHLLDRFSLNNARTLSLRASLHPPTVDGLPPLLELKALATARSVAPGPGRPITLIAPGWGGTTTEAAAIKDANWAASVRSDAGGLGAIGRDGGVGTWAGLTRLAVDTVITVTNDDPRKAQQQYATWQERTADTLRPLGSRLQPRATLACFGTAQSPDLVLIVPSRTGEQPDGFTRALEQFAKAAGLTSKNGIHTMAAEGALIPKLTITTCSAAGTPYLVASIEHNDTRPILRQTIERLSAAK